MKKLLGILFALLIFAAPLAMNAEIEATAGSMKVGAHMDFTYRWSGESNKDPESDEIGWIGYDTFSAGDLMIQITGKVGDRISYKILEGLVYGTFEPIVENPSGVWFPGQWGVIIAKPGTTSDGGLLVAPLEAYVDYKVIDQLKIRVGKTVVPTLIANTGVHMADVIHTANPPLIANRVLGFNEFLVDEFLGFFPKTPLPLDVTGAGVIGNPIKDLELEFYVYDNWLLPRGVPGFLSGQDLGYDFNRTKGWDIAATYKRDILGGKLTARGFYFDEYLDFHNLNWGEPMPNARNFGWGVGAIYDHNLWFVGAEYASDTLRYSEKPLQTAFINIDKKSSTWNGAYILVGGRFISGTIQPVYRFDWIDYTSLKNDDVITTMAPVKITSFDTEIWHTIGVNWLVNDNATVGLNYVIKQPEKGKIAGEKIKYPNINEFVVMMELNLL